MMRVKKGDTVVVIAGKDKEYKLIYQFLNEIQNELV